MGLKSTSNGRLDIALSNAHTLSPRRRTFQTIDVTELAWRLETDTELLVFALISQLMRRCLEDISRRCVLALQLHKSEQRKCSPKIQKQGFRVQFFTFVRERQCHYCAIIKARLQRPLFRARENLVKHFLKLQFSPILCSIFRSSRCCEGVNVVRLLAFSIQIPFSFYLGHSGHSYRVTDIRFFEKKSQLAIALSLQ